MTSTTINYPEPVPDLSLYEDVRNKPDAMSAARVLENDATIGMPEISSRQYAARNRANFRRWVNHAIWIKPSSQSPISLPQLTGDRIFGIDLSQHNGTSGTLAKEDGTADYEYSGQVSLYDTFLEKINAEFCIVQLTRGKHAAAGGQRSNKHAKTQIQKCKNAGIKVGPYHWCSPYAKYQQRMQQGQIELPNYSGARPPPPTYDIQNKIRVVAEARALEEFQVYKEEYDKYDFDITPALDFETCKEATKSNGGWGSQADFGSNASNNRGYAKEVMHNLYMHIHNCYYLIKFCDLIKDDTGNWPLIYTGFNCRAAWLGRDRHSIPWTLMKELGEKSYLWLTQYVSSHGNKKGVSYIDSPYTKPCPPDGCGLYGKTLFPWKTWSIWQFSGHGRVENYHNISEATEDLKFAFYKKIITRSIMGGEKTITSLKRAGIPFTSRWFKRAAERDGIEYSSKDSFISSIEASMSTYSHTAEVPIGIGEFNYAPIFENFDSSPTNPKPFDDVKIVKQLGWNPQNKMDFNAMQASEAGKLKWGG